MSERTYNTFITGSQSFKSFKLTTQFERRHILIGYTPNNPQDLLVWLALIMN